MTVKRSPYKVGEKLTVAQMKDQSFQFDNKAFPSGTGGFVITAIHKTNHRSGGYTFVAESVRNVDGERMKASWMVMFPSFRRKTVKTPYFTSLRFFRGDGFRQVEEKPFIPSLKATVSGNNKGMMLANFLEE